MGPPFGEKKKKHNFNSYIFCFRANFVKFDHTFSTSLAKKINGKINGVQVSGEGEGRVGGGGGEGHLVFSCDICFARLFLRREVLLNVGLDSPEHERPQDGVQFLDHIVASALVCLQADPKQNIKTNTRDTEMIHRRERRPRLTAKRTKKNAENKCP